MYAPLDTALLSYCVLSKTDLDDIHSYFEWKKIPKKTFLLEQGQRCNFDAFVLKGLIKMYFIDAKGTEVILNFATEQWWVSDLTSFQEQRPSIFFIETLEEVELLTLNLTSKEALLKQFPTLERFFRCLVERHLSFCQNRLLGRITQTAEERYHAFLKHYPLLQQRIPQHQIAAYLGISPEFLSRIRAKK